MRLGLEGRRGLVTGGSKGLGEAIARELVSEGARVAICSRNEQEVTATAEEVGAEYAQAADVTDPEQVRDLRRPHRGRRWAGSTSSSTTRAALTRGPSRR